MRKQRFSVAAIAAALLWAAPHSAQALTSVEGFALGDQGYYWNTPAEAWIFPHRIGNVDNRAMLQIDAIGLQPITGQAINTDNVVGPTLFNNFAYNAEGAQLGTGGGLVLELMENLNAGFWVGQFNPGHGGFVDRGVGRLDWAHAGGVVNDLDGIDPYIPGFEAGRKIDLFLSYWIPELGLETGLRLWWGSNRNRFTPDNSFGPIRIDRDGDPATGQTDPPLGVGQEVELSAADSVYRLTDFGFGIGAAYTAIEDLRVDLGFDMNFLGVSWKPNDISNYVDANGLGLGVNLRAHYDVAERWTVGGFFRFRNQSSRFAPQRRRDGGDLPEAFLALDADQAAALPDPNLGGAPSAAGAPTGDPATGAAADTLAPVRNLQYRERLTEMQLAGLLSYRPAYWATLYTAVGFDRRTALERVELTNEWFNERHGRLMALPFIHAGFAGRVFDWLDVTIGVRRRWQDLQISRSGFDNRIPKNDFYEGAANNPDPLPGREDATNARRRDQTVRAAQDRSDTALMLGARVFYRGFQVMANMNPNFLVDGPNFISGNTTPNWNGWVALIYDWDWDQDLTAGNGTLRPSPHVAEPPPAGQPAPAPAPAPQEQPAPAPMDDF